MRFENKVMLITGAASGIGKVTAEWAAREGAHVMLSDRDSAAGEAAAHAITQQGGRAEFVACDVTKGEQITAMVDATLAAFGKLDCAVNNAGIGGSLALTHEQTEEMWDLIMNINLKGVWLCMRAQLPPMLQAGKGSIVNLASLAGLIGFPYGQAYGASKHGVIGLTRGAALEYARRGVRVNAVCPGFTNTPMVDGLNANAPRFLESSLSQHPMRRLGTPEESAAAILWLCSDEASFINGHALSVDGGVAVS
jgi:NAD(P)-dependent dehydrogenase (short-subunit alcohol dehydrogenase family)